jgi:hypothetical protein
MEFIVIEILCFLVPDYPSPRRQGFQSYHSSVDHNSGVFGRFRSRHNRPASFDNEILSSRTVDLCTSTIKMDAEDMDLRLCFRIISPSKTYTLQVFIDCFSII